MTDRVEVKTKTAAEKALKSGKAIRIIGGAFALNLVGLPHVNIEVAPQAMWDIDISITGSAELWGSSRAELWGSSRAVLRGSSRAELWGSSSAELWGSSSAVLLGSSSAVLRESSRAVLRESSRAELWGSSSAELWESSRAELWESSRAVLRESSRAELWGSSRADAFGYSMLQLHGQQIKATATKTVFVNLWKGAKCKGGQQQTVKFETPKDWCEYYGVPVVRGKVTLFKAVNAQYHSQRGGDYTPGSRPVADIWDGGKIECSHGLHWSPTTAATHEFVTNLEKYVAASHKLSDLVCHFDGSYPQKVMTRTVAGPVFEVDRDGNPV